MPTRPPALIRGPSAKPRSRQLGAFTSRAASASAASPTFCRAAITLQALRDERAVEALQPRDVGDGAERDEVEQVDDLRLGAALRRTPRAAKLAQQRDAEQERHADRREMAVRSAVLALVEPVGIDQRMRDRKQARALVVVDDDDVEPGRRALRSSASNACAPQSTQTATLGAARLQFDQRFARRAVALHQPVGDIDDGLGAEPPQQQHQQRRAGRAVDVIVAEDRDRLAALDRVGEPLGALVHVLEAGRVGQEVADLGIAMARQIVARDAAGEQQLVDQRVHAEAVVGLPPPAPRLAGHRLVDVERGSHGRT